MKSKIPKCVIITVFLFLLFGSILAEQTVKTLNIPIKYVASISATKDYVFPINIKVPDGITDIISAELIIKGDFLKGSIITGMMEGKDGVLYRCNPLSWTTPPVSTYGYELSFDCSDLVRKYDAKEKEISFEQYDFKENREMSFGVRSNTLAKNLRAIIQLTYHNRPETIVQIFGTEYSPSENGTVFLQLFDSNENTVDDAYCELTIFYPDKTKWYDSIYMDFLESGLYYKDVFIPDDKLGVYMLNVFCSYQENVYEYKLPSEDIIYNGHLITLNYLSTDDAEAVEDTDCVFVATDGGTYQEFRYNYTTIGNINITQVEEITLFWVGSNERNGAYLQAWDFTTSSWDTIGATFTKTDVTPFQCERSHAVSRSITSSFSDYIYQDEIRFRFVGGSNGEIYTDEATIIFHDGGTFIDAIRGGGEIHVSSLSGLLENVSVSVNLTGIPEDVWTYYNRSLTEEVSVNVTLDLCDVWDCSSRTLTQNMTCDVDLGNVTVSASYTDICLDDCEIGQLQYSYPDCSCYCETPCTDGKVQDDHCDCYVPKLTEVMIMDEVGVHDLLSYEAQIQEEGTDILLSGVECDIVIYRGDEVFQVSRDIMSQKSGVLLGQYRVWDEFMVDSTYNFTIQCGESLVYKEFNVTTEHRPTFVLNTILFIKENVEAIVIIAILMGLVLIGIWKYIKG